MKRKIIYGDSESIYIQNEKTKENKTYHGGITALNTSINIKKLIFNADYNYFSFPKVQMKICFPINKNNRG